MRELYLDVKIDKLDSETIDLFDYIDLDFKNFQKAILEDYDVGINENTSVYRSNCNFFSKEMEGLGFKDKILLDKNIPLISLWKIVQKIDSYEYKLGIDEVDTFLSGHDYISFKKFYLEDLAKVDYIDVYETESELVEEVALCTVDDLYWQYFDYSAFMNDFAKNRTIIQSSDRTINVEWKNE